MSTNKSQTINYVIGGMTVASLALLAYVLTRQSGKVTPKLRKKNSAKDVMKYTFTKKPFETHLVMGDPDGFNAHVAGDKKNLKFGLK